MSDEDDEAGESIDHTGRTVKLETAAYSVEVYGDPDDPLYDVVAAAHRAADHARKDVEELDDRIVNTDGDMCR
jgi:hypothetical protein